VAQPTLSLTYSLATFVMWREINFCDVAWKGGAFVLQFLDISFGEHEMLKAINSVAFLISILFYLFSSYFI